MAIFPLHWEFLPGRVEGEYGPRGQDAEGLAARES